MRLVTDFNILYDIPSGLQLDVFGQLFKTCRISVVVLFNSSRDGSTESHSLFIGQLVFEKLLANSFFRASI